MQEVKRVSRWQERAPPGTPGAAVLGPPSVVIPTSLSTPPTSTAAVPDSVTAVLGPFVAASGNPLQNPDHLLGKPAPLGAGSSPAPGPPPAMGRPPAGGSLPTRPAFLPMPGFPPAPGLPPDAGLPMMMNAAMSLLSRFQPGTPGVSLPSGPLHGMGPGPVRGGCGPPGGINNPAIQKILQRLPPRNNQPRPFAPPQMNFPGAFMEVAG